MSLEWYAAHLIFLLPSKNHFQIEEQIWLISATNFENAKEASLRHAKEIETQYPDKIFKGHRRLIKISNPFPLDLYREPPVSGTEITYNDFVLDNVDDVQKFLHLEPVTVERMD